MFSHTSQPSKKEYKVMTEQQFEEIVQAVLAGKYSWACVLILRAGGYNPLHYIPYRTYNRLIKNNCLGKRKVDQTDEANLSRKVANSQSKDMQKQHPSSKVNNLDYLEKVNHNEGKIYGGYSIQWNFPY
jgi:hypothetical protein